MPQLIVEECTRSGAHVAYYAVNRFPLRIGRALDNDIVLADPFVSPMHLVIDDSGDAWILFDQDSENGTFTGKGEKLSDPAYARSGDQVTIGKTVLRLWSPHHAPTPTLRIATPRSIAARTLLPAFALMSQLMVGVIILWQQHLDTAKETPPVSLLAGAIPYLLLPLLWAGLWAVAGFIVRRKSRYSLQLLCSNIALIIFILLSLFVEYIDFVTGSIATAETVQYAGIAMLAIVLLFINLTLTGGMNDLRRIVAATIVGVAAVTAIAVSDHADSEENRIAPVYSHTLEPWTIKLSRTSSLDQFISESGKIFRGEEK